MAHDSLCEFDLKKESIKDFHEHFEFYCVANGIQDGNAAKKKAMFIMLLGQETFAKLKVLGSPTGGERFDISHHCTAFDSAFSPGHH